MSSCDKIQKSQSSDFSQKNNETSLNAENQSTNSSSSIHFSKTSSQYYEIYEKFLTNFHAETDLSQYLDLFKENKIMYQRSKCSKKINITVLHKSRGFKVVTLFVSFSYFTFEIKLLNLARRSQFEEFEYVGQGNFGSVCACRLFQDGQNFVIKHISYHNIRLQNQRIGQSNIRKKLSEVILEYCYCKLFSVLRIGPYVSSFLGFDIIVFSDSVQFTMELCQPAIQKTLKKDLCTSLKFMHSLDIVHGDIKPQNIMWSPKYQKNVFIDFGLTLHLKQSIGLKTFTHYFGTYGYSSPQMKAIFNDSTMNYVDLYYNDLHGLKMSFHKSSKIQPIKVKKTIDYPKQKHLSFLLNIKLMSFIYENEILSIIGFISKYKMLQIEDEAILLFLQLQTNRCLSKMSKLLIQNYTISKQIQNKISLYQQRRIIQPQINQLTSNIFQSRIQQVLTDYMGNMNDVMIFTMLLSNQNPTPSAAYFKTIFAKNLNKLNPQQPQFWQNFIKYSINLYVGQFQYQQVIELTRTKLGLNQWQPTPYKQLQMFSRTYKIAQIVLKNYNINLFQQYGKVHKQFQTQFFPKISHILFRLQNCKKLKQYYQLIANIDQWKNDGIQKYKQFYKTMANIHFKIDIPEEKTQELTYYFHNFFKTLFKSVDSVMVDTQWQQVFLETFTHFQPAKRIFLLSRMRYGCIFWSLKKDDQKVAQLLHFFKSSFNICFTKYFFIQFQSFNLVLELDKYRYPTPQIIEAKIMKMLQMHQLFFSAPSFLAMMHYSLVFMSIFCRKILFENSQVIFNILENKMAQKNYEIDENQFSYIFQIIQILPVIYRQSKRQTFISKILHKFAVQCPRNQKILLILYKLTLQSRYRLLNRNQWLMEAKQFISQYYQHLFKNDTLCLSQQIIARMIQQNRIKNQFPQLQFQLLRHFILNNNQGSFNLFMQLTIGHGLAECYGSKFEEKFDDYFKILCKLFQYSHSKVQENLNFITYAFIKGFLERFLFMTPQLQSSKVKQKFYNCLLSLYRQNPRDFLQKHANAIFIIQSLFCHSFSIEEKFDLEENSLFTHISLYLKLASYWINDSTFYFQRTFKSSMCYWILELYQKQILACKSDKKKIKMYLRGLRNFQFNIQKRFVIKLSHKMDPIRNCYQKTQAYDNLKSKFESIKCNKLSKQIQTDSFFTNLYPNFNRLYNIWINNENPNCLLNNITVTKIRYM